MSLFHFDVTFFDKKDTLKPAWLSHFVTLSLFPFYLVIKNKNLYIYIYNKIF